MSFFDTVQNLISFDFINTTLIYNTISKSIDNFPWQTFSSLFTKSRRFCLLNLKKKNITYS